jgi:competence protein ComEA
MENKHVIVSTVLIIALLLSLPGIYFYTEGAPGGKSGGIKRAVSSFGVVEADKVRIPSSSELPNTDFTLQPLTRSERNVVEQRLKIDINTANAVALSTIHGVGPSTAQSIIRYRENNGGFNSVDELTNVSGIGSKTVEKMRSEVKIGNMRRGRTSRTVTRKPEPRRKPRATPSNTTDADKININSASAQELTQINGVGPATAGNIISYREQHGRIKNTDDLQNVSGIGPATAAKMADQITF